MQHLKDWKERCKGATPDSMNRATTHSDILTKHQWNLFKWVKRGHLTNTCCWMSKQKVCNMHAVWIMEGREKTTTGKKTWIATVRIPLPTHTQTQHTVEAKTQHASCEVMSNWTVSSKWPQVMREMERKQHSLQPPKNMSGHIHTPPHHYGHQQSDVRRGGTQSVAEQ